MKKQLIFTVLTAIIAVSFTLTNVQGYQIGDKAEDFSLKNIDGKMMGMKDFADARGYIVVFTCNSCPYAQAYEQRMIDLNTKYAPQGYPVIAINPNAPSVTKEDSYKKMQTRAKSKKYAFPYLFDEKQDVFPKFGASRTPTVYVLDKEKTIKYIGSIDDNADDATAVTTKYVENAVEALKLGKNPDPSVTKAIGCSIKKKRT